MLPGNGYGFELCRLRRALIGGQQKSGYGEPHDPTSIDCGFGNPHGTDQASNRSRPNRLQNFDVSLAGPVGCILRLAFKSQDRVKISEYGGTDVN